MVALIIFALLAILLFFVPMRRIPLWSLHNAVASLVTAFLIVLTCKLVGAAVVWTFVG